MQHVQCMRCCTFALAELEELSPSENFCDGCCIICSIELKFSVAYGRFFALLLNETILPGYVRSQSYDVIYHTPSDTIPNTFMLTAGWHGAVGLNGNILHSTYIWISSGLHFISNIVSLIFQGHIRSLASADPLTDFEWHALRGAGFLDC